MGACCTCQRGDHFGGGLIPNGDDMIEEEREREADEGVIAGDFGARVRLHGSSKHISMFTQQGRKGTNQDSLTVWENFGGEKDAYYCGVFDGHGPSGHKVARYIRDKLPSKLSSSFKRCPPDEQRMEHNSNRTGQDPKFPSWETNLFESFKEVDEDLEAEDNIDSYCSGTTSVSVLKKGGHLMIANLGDSRAVLCTRGNDDQLVPVQLTVDLKPNIPSEVERIKTCGGRVKAMENEPSVFRVWMPDQDCPGLAMSRAFGDFCIKDYGLISVPDVSYRKLTDKDEFVVLATDGIWDVLSNNEVIRIVASARRRSMAARLLIDRAVRAWRYKYPASKVDDCAVVCLFFKDKQPVLMESVSEVTHLSMNYTELGAIDPSNAPATTEDDGLDTVLNCDVKESETKAPDPTRRRRRSVSKEVVVGTAF